MNIIDYLKTEFNSFDKKKFSEVDSLILSQLSYVLFEDFNTEDKLFCKPVKIKDIFLAEKLDDMLKNLLYPDKNRELVILISGSPRFREIEIKHYVNEVDKDLEKQFSAVCFVLNRNTAYIAFRGTDISFVGWKEDFNMSFMDEVPAQKRSVEYINSISSKLPRNILVGGHSKGGNLAVYAASMCSTSVKRRIKAIYSHDGPGFKALLDTKEYLSVKEKIHKTVPQSSIIGMLLSTHEDYTVVKSNSMGILQHDAFTWEIKNGNFIKLDKINTHSKLMDETLTQWLFEMTDQERKRYVEFLFDFVDAAQVNTVYDLQKIKLKDIKAVADMTKKLDDDTKKFLFDVFKKLALMPLKIIRQ